MSWYFCTAARYSPTLACASSVSARICGNLRPQWRAMLLAQKGIQGIQAIQAKHKSQGSGAHPNVDAGAKSLQHRRSHLGRAAELHQLLEHVAVLLGQNLPLKCRNPLLNNCDVIAEGLDAKSGGPPHRLEGFQNLLSLRRCFACLNRGSSSAFKTKQLQQSRR